MSNTLSQRRMIDNEVVFRTYNEQVETGFEKLKAIANEDNQNEEVFETDTPLQFYCECSDEDCRKRVTLEPSRYVQIHKKRNRFVIVRGHETKEIERVVSEEDGFCIIEKDAMPPESAPGLQKTNVHNT